ncbi:MAG: DUF47 domain-containing protein [Candidatus Heimdallarchaeota archaeon]
MADNGESSLLHWFRHRRNQAILSKLDLHSEKVLDTCQTAVELIDHLRDPEAGLAEKIFKRLSRQERSADHIQDELANEIARGLLPPEIREKLFRLVRLVDSTANWTKTAGKNLAMLVKLELPTGQFTEILDQFHAMAQLNIESIRVFRKMTAALGKDDQTILDNRQVIEDRERECDNVYLRSLEDILTIDEEHSYAIHFLFIDTARNLENASDSVSSASDVLYTIVMLGIPS